MRMAWILVQQILQMFVLAGMGYLLFKTKKITAEGSKALGNILIWLSLPATIINGFLVEPTRQHLYGFIQSGIAALVLLLLSAGVSALCFRKDAIAAFAGAFSNPGFFGVPLIIASLGRESVFYVACFIALLNIGQWTYGVSLMTGRRIREGFRLKKLLTAPFMVTSFTLNNILRYEGKAALGMIGLITGAILNIAGDAILMIHFKMGITGAGLSTAVSQMIIFSILILNVK